MQTRRPPTKSRVFYPESTWKGYRNDGNSWAYIRAQLGESVTVAAFDHANSVQDGKRSSVVVGLSLPELEDRPLSPEWANESDDESSDTGRAESSGDTT